MKSVILEAFQDEMTGEVGLGVQGMPRDETTNAAHDGLLIAHDFLEHVNGSQMIGTIVDELEALGAMWYVRGQWGELRRDGIGSTYTVYQNIAGDITRMYRDALGNGNMFFDAMKTLPVTADSDIQEILVKADRTYLTEFDGEEKREAILTWPSYRKCALAHMRIGYTKARRKYEHRGRWYANNLFWAIADAVNPYAKHVEEGSQFKLIYGERDGEVAARCEEFYDL